MFYAIMIFLWQDVSVTENNIRQSATLMVIIFPLVLLSIFILCILQLFKGFLRILNCSIFVN